YSEKSRCFIVISTVSGPFSQGVQPSKPHEVQPYLQVGETLHEPSLQPPRETACNHCVTSCVTELHTVGAGLLQPAP
ncbi:MAG: hypothetical protein ACJ8HF_20435, partial [Pseudomonas sp.]